MVRVAAQGLTASGYPYHQVADRGVETSRLRDGVDADVFSGDSKEADFCMVSIRCCCCCSAVSLGCSGLPLLTSEGCRLTAAEKESRSIREPAPRNEQRGDPIYGTRTRRQEGDHRRVRYPSR
jgi:hypothetical protein